MFSSDALIRDFLTRKDPFVLLEIIAFLVPAYFYRFSIKSTWWFYYPLVYIASERDLAANPEKIVNRLREAPWERVSRWIAYSTLGAVFIFNLLPGILQDTHSNLIISKIEYLLFLDWSAVSPWLICSLVSAAITVGAFVLALHAHSDLSYPGGQGNQLWLDIRIIILRYGLRIRTLVSTAAMIILGLHVLLAFTRVITWVPSSTLPDLCWFYSNHLPICP
jgi:hypothetical protein